MNWQRVGAVSVATLWLSILTGSAFALLMVIVPQIDGQFLLAVSISLLVSVGVLLGVALTLWSLMTLSALGKTQTARQSETRR